MHKPSVIELASIIIMLSNNTIKKALNIFLHILLYVKKTVKNKEQPVISPSFRSSLKSALSEGITPYMRSFPAFFNLCLDL